MSETRSLSASQDEGRGDIATRFINEVRGISCVVYEGTSKLPGTIEWE